MADTKLRDLPAYAATMNGTEALYVAPTDVVSNQVTTQKLADEMKTLGNYASILTDLDDVDAAMSPNASEVLTWSGSEWSSAPPPAGGTGDVSGPAGGVVVDEIPLYSDTTGKVIKGSSGAKLSDYTTVSTFNTHVGNTGNPHSTALDALSDVTVTTPATGEILVRNAGNNGWENAAPPSGTGDVTGPAGGVVDNEIAVYSGTTGKIIKGSGGALLSDYALSASLTAHTGDTNNPHSTALDALSDVTLTTPATGEILVRNSGNDGWENAPAPSGSGDVTGPAGGVVDNEIAIYSGTTGKIIKGSGGALLADYAKVAEAITENTGENTHANPLKYAVMTEASHPGAGADADTIYFLT